MRKKWIMVLMVLGMTLFLWGCGKANNAGGETSVLDGGAGESATELSYWTFVELHGQHFEKMLGKWNAENPDRQIKLNVTVMPYDDMHNKLSIAVQSGTGAPDIADIELGKFPDFLAGTPQLEALNDVIDPYRDTIVKSRIDLYSKDGVNYGVPTHVGASVAFYNTEILEEAGVNYQDIVTWEDFKQAGIQVYEKTGKYMGTADTSAAWQASMLLAQQGADLTDDSGNPVVNSEPMIKAMTLLKDLQDSNAIATIAGGQPDTEEAYGEFNAGNYATAFMPLWQMSRYTNYMSDLSGKIAIAPIPVIEEGMPRSVGGGGTGTVVTKTAKDVQLAKDFLAFAKLSLDANKEIWNTLGFDPVNMDVWDMKDVTHNPENQFVQYFVNNPFDVLNEIRDEIRLIKSTSASPTINNVLCTTTFNEIFEDGKDITEALNDAQKQIEQELK
ncbi:carbohydrate ABC transporter substrate-binding protein [Paenibacillus glucanolyticus]|jgi:arabinosaccharide transport system substrate-binding protein|uniref:ABC transporter substrate-binding protein n=1 Tax=Paenibacillus TaxID=44249 RepID=UPI0003E22616|nr:MULTISPECIES: ABC transporter substrate-binding protein [Paenibacillus]ANA81522.1 ABC transporter substrate-binding protein [Paenibacillus glucanolyticus]AVV59746.1 carbohydrate ABC transporter substrate-binding protein [Paenibacillus glucanolyticus]ETT33468.1 family 1 extracellular solute-binding protein [Paenibacillus sp. FSL R5-808]MPY19454.1 carbohydrate ABC transporter substrate-binding protein [Paenibacillus glucanolyticus]